MKILNKLVLSSVLLMSSSVIAGGLTASGKISLLSHEFSGSYVQILDATNAIINTDPDNCGGAEMYFLPLEHANYSVLSSSLLTAETTQRELAFHVEGCENGMAKIAFVRFGNWDAVVLNTPTTPPSTPPTGSENGGTQTFLTSGSTTTNATFNVPDGVNRVYVTMCGGGGAGGKGRNGSIFGGGGATTLLKVPYIVQPNQAVDIIVGGGAAGCSGGGAYCDKGEDSRFGSLIAPGATSAEWDYPTQKYKAGSTVLPLGYEGSESYIVRGGIGGSGSTMDGGSVPGRKGGAGFFLNTLGRSGGGGASFLGQGGNGAGHVGEDGQGFCSGGGGATPNGSTVKQGGSGAPGIVIVEW